ncbi:DUF4625 domain-containing protein [Sabulibacter ruber]|uniref:DUF4625 domain-containing protein n=1 Tax=Sabulibacter ruber TaxID=2811901 RepID=UPI001A96F355
MKVYLQQYLFLLLALSIFASCDDDDAPVLPQPTIDNIEIGLNNNEMAVVGRDFHFNAKIQAGNKIENVVVKIQQRSGETYAKVWSHEVNWTEYNGSATATVHKHFDIPADAPEGKYDFLITVNDQNGTKLEVKKNLSLYTAENLPVDPKLSIFNIFAKEAPYYRNGRFVTPGTSLQKGDLFNSQVAISGVKGSGKMYLLLINKKANHRPESIENIDFGKAIVYDVYEHKDWATVDHFTNSVFDEASYSMVREWPNLTIGAATDNNTPAGPITGSKAWETGDYYFGVVYKNTTYNMSFFHYMEVPVNVN